MWENHLISDDRGEIRWTKASKKHNILWAFHSVTNLCGSDRQMDCPTTGAPWPSNFTIISTIKQVQQDAETHRLQLATYIDLNKHINI